MFVKRMMRASPRRARFREIQAVSSLESERLRRSLQESGHLSPIVDGVFELYHLLMAIRERFTPPNPRGDALAVILAFTLHCQRNYAQAVLMTLRGHSGDADLFTRRAIEMAAIARLVGLDPNVAQEWAGAGVSEAQYRKYRRAFRSKTLFPEDHPLMQRLHEAYDECSRRCHPSVHGIGDNMVIEATDHRVRVQVRHLCDPDGENVSVPLTWTAHTHALILDVLADATDIAASPKRTVWDALRAGLEARIARVSEDENRHTLEENDRAERSE